MKMKRTIPKSKDPIRKLAMKVARRTQDWEFAEGADIIEPVLRVGIEPYRMRIEQLRGLLVDALAYGISHDKKGTCVFGDCCQCGKDELVAAISKVIKL